MIFNFNYGKIDIFSMIFSEIHQLHQHFNHHGTHFPCGPAYVARARRQLRQVLLRRLRGGDQDAAAGGAMLEGVPGIQNHRKTMGKPWENHGKMVISWDLMGKP